MPTGSHTSLEERIRAALTPPAAGLAGANAIAETASIMWRMMVVQLRPVIGARGVDALYGRALHQTIAVFPWLAAAVDRRGDGSPLSSLMACLAGQPPAAAAEAIYTLLFKFAELLATLIGEPLTNRLLAPVWERSSPSARQESAP